MRIPSIIMLMAGHCELSTGEAAAGHRYCNSRFEFCIVAPATLYPQGESDAGDGQTFLSRDARVSLAVWGNWGNSEGTPSFVEAFRQASRGWPAGNGQPARVVTYKVFKPSFFVVSGVEAGKVFYQA